MILTNSLTQIVDEGATKVANSLIRRMKQAEPSLTVLSCGAEAEGSDVHIPSNKLLLNGKLAMTIRRSGEDLLYMPSYARMLPTAVRVFLLSFYTRGKLRVLLPMISPMGRLPRWLFRRSGAEIICLSADARDFYRREIGGPVLYLRTGVDTARFAPVSPEKKAELRRKYGIPLDKPVVLHVGHMTQGRNIEEIYQLADVYLFPVQQALKCIDVPLSALEAAACGVPVVSTVYGEMTQVIGQEGFYALTDMSPEALNALLKQAVQDGKNPRSAVLPYDWANAVQTLLKQPMEKEA